MTHDPRHDSSRDRRVYEEASALWQALYGEAPPSDIDGARMIDSILTSLPDADYFRLSSPFLRASNITWAKPEPGPIA